LSLRVLLSRKQVDRAVIHDLPDPGMSVLQGPVRWRILPEEKDLLEVLAGVELHRLGEVPGLEAVRAKDHLLWGKLRFRGRDYFLKWRMLTRLRRRLVHLFRPSRMRLEWRKTWWLRSRGIETAEPVAIGEVRRFGILTANLFVGRWLPAARNLSSYLEEKSRNLPAAEFERLRRKLVRALGGLLGSLHRLGAFHRQFNDLNVLVVEDAAGAPRLLPVDLDHLSLGPPLGSDECAWNFFQLGYHLRGPFERWGRGARDLMRFLRGYQDAAGGSASDLDGLKRWVVEILPERPLERRPRRRDFAERYVNLRNPHPCE
jgi:tRNA A-37 threonylcarbamoyl transferase component Bud32